MFEYMNSYELDAIWPNIVQNGVGVKHTIFLIKNAINILNVVFEADTSNCNQSSFIV